MALHLVVKVGDDPLSAVVLDYLRLVYGPEMINDIRGFNLTSHVGDVQTLQVTLMVRDTKGMTMAEKDSGGTAPNTGKGSDQKRDDKATADGKPVDPNRPHTDK